MTAAMKDFQLQPIWIDRRGRVPRPGGTTPDIPIISGESVTARFRDGKPVPYNGVYIIQTPTRKTTVIARREKRSPDVAISWDFVEIPTVALIEMTGGVVGGGDLDDPFGSPWRGAVSEAD